MLPGFRTSGTGVGTQSLQVAAEQSPSLFESGGGEGEEKSMF